MKKALRIKISLLHAYITKKTAVVAGNPRLTVPVVVASFKLAQSEADRPPERPPAGMLDRVKDGGRYVAVKRRTLDRV